MTEWAEDFRRFHERTGFRGEFRYDEPMATHTTFRVGGPADLWVRPQGDCFPDYGAALLGFARSQGIPVFVLGGGANLVVADRGIRGIVLDTGAFTGAAFPEGPDSQVASFRVSVRAGTTMDALVDAAAERGWGGLEFLAGMPGTLGGAVWMNARCMETSISDVLVETEILDESLNRCTVPCRREDFSYKMSPFQDRDVLILGAVLTVQPRAGEAIRREATELRQDRERKGHFRAPSAGSAFKNNRDFGQPTGKIIDDMGLRGLVMGGVAVAPWHGNFIINTGNATAADIRALTEAVTERVHAALGIHLEPEIRFVGEW